MITNTSYASREIWLPPLVVVAVLLGFALGGDYFRELFRYDREAIASGQWWRLWTGNYVHLGWWHWFLNELGLIIYVLLCPERLAFSVWLRRIFFLSIGMTAGLFFFVQDVRWYVGMSGVIHGLFVLGLVPQVLKKDLIAAGCLAYLLGKVAWEMIVGVPVSDEEALGGRVLVESHLYGSLSAFIYGLVFQSFFRLETFNPFPPRAAEPKSPT